MYAKGRGVPKDYLAATKLFQFVSKNDLAVAQHQPARPDVCQGQDVAENYVSAVRWLKLAAKHGIASAQ